MPIYEYRCRACSSEFEFLLLPAQPTTAACPSCKSEDLERQLSTFAVSTEDMTRARVKSARKAAVGSRDHKDKQIAEAEHIREHIQESREASEN